MLQSNSSIEDVLSFLRGPAKPVPRGYETWEVTKDAHERAVREFVDNPPPAPKFAGRGVVIPAGGAAYFTSAYVCMRSLREAGCNLDISLWFMGDAEMDGVMRKVARQLGADCVDAFRVREEHPCRILAGWELKPYAACFAPFEEILFLDADNAVLHDPTFLLENEAYEKHGSIWWSDFPHWMWNQEQYEAFRLPPPEKLDVPVNDHEFFGKRINFRRWPRPVFESGQFVVNKRKCWRELRLALWLCERSDFVFKWLHGDKDTFLLAWEKFGTKFAMPPFWPDWCGMYQIGHDFIGQPLLHHRTAGSRENKLSLRGENKRSPNLDGEEERFSWLPDLAKVWSGTPWKKLVKSAEDLARERALTGTYWHYCRVGLDERSLKLADDNKIEGGGEREATWSVWAGEPDGDRLCVFGADGKLTAVLKESDSGWSGRWASHERCEVSLSLRGAK